MSTAAVGEDLHCSLVVAQDVVADEAVLVTLDDYSSAQHLVAKVGATLRAATCHSLIANRLHVGECSEKGAVQMGNTAMFVFAQQFHTR